MGAIQWLLSLMLSKLHLLTLLLLLMNTDHSVISHVGMVLWCTVCRGEFNYDEVLAMLSFFVNTCCLLGIWVCVWLGKIYVLNQIIPPVVSLFQCADLTVALFVQNILLQTDIVKKFRFF